MTHGKRANMAPNVSCSGKDYVTGVFRAVGGRAAVVGGPLTRINA